MKHIIFVGKPGSGKSTIAKSIAMRYGLHYISSGDIARSLSDEFTKEQLAHGGMANEVIIRDMINSRMHLHRKSGIVYDGVPRSTSQYEWLMSTIHSLYSDAVVYPKICVIHINIPDDECYRRLTSRGRDDDSTEIIKKRIAMYHILAPSMIHIMEITKYVDTYQFSGIKPIGDIFDEVVEKIDEWDRKPPEYNVIGGL